MSARAALFLALGLVGGTANAAQPLPPWTAYHGERDTMRAWRALAERRTADALVHAERAAALQPDRTEPLHVLCRARIADRDWDGAWTANLALRRIQADSPTGLELQGLIGVELGLAAEARSAFEALAGLEPAAPGPLLGIALVAARLEQDVKGAIRSLARARELDPSLDLTTLLLQPGWTPLADDSSFVAALTALLAAPPE